MTKSFSTLDGNFTIIDDETGEVIAKASPKDTIEMHFGEGDWYLLAFNKIHTDIVYKRNSKIKSWIKQLRNWWSL